MTMKNLLAAAVLGLFPFAAMAGSYDAHVTGAPGSSVTLNVTFTGDGNTDETEITLNYDNTLIAITNPVPATGGDSCFVVSPTQIRIVPRSGAGGTLPTTEFTACSFTVAIDGAAPEANIPFAVASVECADVDANPVAPCTLDTPSGVTVQTQQTPLTLSYAPAAGTTITFAAGNLGASAPDQTITATATGNSGTASLNNCVVSNPTAFNVTPASLTFNAAGDQALTVGCDYQAAATAGTLTCSETDADSAAVTRTWNLSCPAGAIVPANPTIGSNPASGSTVTVSGAAVGQLGTATIDLTATGGAGAGSTAISCTSTGTVRISLVPTTPTGQGPIAQTVTGTAQPTDLRVGVALTGAAQSPAGTITCTVAGQADLVYTVAAPAGTVFVPPTVVPSASTWSKIALFSLLGLFGVLAVRRFS